MESSTQKRSRVKKIITTLAKSHPDAKLALDFSNPLELLIALILAAQARDDLVNSVEPGSLGLMLQPYWAPGLKQPGPGSQGRRDWFWGCAHPPVFLPFHD